MMIMKYVFLAGAILMANANIGRGSVFNELGLGDSRHKVIEAAIPSRQQ